jgi:hypothetical protein
MSAYNAVGNDFWNHRLFLLHADSKYIDVMDLTLYNGLISGVSLGQTLRNSSRPENILHVSSQINADKVLQTLSHRRLSVFIGGGAILPALSILSRDSTLEAWVPAFAGGAVSMNFRRTG